ENQLERQLGLALQIAENPRCMDNNVLVFNVGRRHGIDAMLLFRVIDIFYFIADYIELTGFPNLPLIYTQLLYGKASALPVFGHHLTRKRSIVTDGIGTRNDLG